MTEIQERLVNWARWARVRPHYSSCKSLEGRYKAPPTWHPPEPKIHVDTLDAAVIEKALVNPSFPKKARELIKYSYLYPQINHMKMCRKLGIKNNDIDGELRMAILMLENRLKIKAEEDEKVRLKLKNMSEWAERAMNKEFLDKYRKKVA